MRRSATPAVVVRIAGQDSQSSTACVQEPDKLPAFPSGSGGSGVCTTTRNMSGRSTAMVSAIGRPESSVVEADRDDHGRLAGAEPEAARHRWRRRLQLDVQRRCRRGARSSLARGIARRCRSRAVGELRSAEGGSGSSAIPARRPPPACMPRSAGNVGRAQRSRLAARRSTGTAPRRPADRPAAAAPS